MHIQVLVFCGFVFLTLEFWDGISSVLVQLLFDMLGPESLYFVDMFNRGGIHRIESHKHLLSSHIYLVVVTIIDDSIVDLFSTSHIYHMHVFQVSIYKYMAL